MKKLVWFLLVASAFGQTGYSVSPGLYSGDKGGVCSSIGVNVGKGTTTLPDGTPITSLGSSVTISDSTVTTFGYVDTTGTVSSTTATSVPAGDYPLFKAQPSGFCTVKVASLIGDIFFGGGRGLLFTLYSNSGLVPGTTTASTDYLTVPFSCKLTAYNIVIDTGTITVKFWKVGTGTAIPTSSNSINTSGVGVSSGTAIHSTIMTDFTSTAVTANDILAMNVTAVSGNPTFVNAVLQCQ